MQPFSEAQSGSIVGFAPGTSLSAIVTEAARQVQRKQGAPCVVTAIGRGIELRAKRENVNDAFHAIAIRFSGENDLPEPLTELVTNDDRCTVDSVAGSAELRILENDAAAMETLLVELTEAVSVPETWRIRGSEFNELPLSPGDLYRGMRDLTASDVHLFPGCAAVFRSDGELIWTEDESPLSAQQIVDFIRTIAPDEAWKNFERHGHCNFQYQQIGHGYSRVSAFRKSDAPHCTIRFLTETIPSFDDLSIPAETMVSLAGLHDGLILVSGMTGSGKSTTVAAILDWINVNRARHILTIEEPVEYVHVNKQSVVSQREVGVDTETFTTAVRSALRHDPDVVFVGEMRDSDTIRAVISAAATGHLVVSTLHASTASDVVSRILSFFDPSERDLVRLQLHDCMRCVINQRLLPRKEGGRIPALEFLFNDSTPISAAILAGDTNALRIGMQQILTESSIYETALLELEQAGEITDEVANTFAPNPQTLEQMRIGTYRPPTLEPL